MEGRNERSSSCSNIIMKCCVYITAKYPPYTFKFVTSYDKCQSFTSSFLNR